jgi:hypothetical protein
MNFSAKMTKSHAQKTQAKTSLEKFLALIFIFPDVIKYEGDN